MTPLEELQAAHKRLSELRRASTPGSWVVRDMDDPDGLNDGDTAHPMSPVGQGWWWVWAAQPNDRYGGVMEAEGRMKSVGQAAIEDHDGGHQERADADLIVTLHRTIDAQLATLTRTGGLLVAAKYLPPGASLDSVMRSIDSALDLARAINGGSDDAA